MVDLEGGRYLATPRDVMRTLNAIRLYWYPVRDHVDFADMVWLQLIRVNVPDFYDWLEEYVRDTTDVGLGAAIHPDTIVEMKKRLLKLFPKKLGRKFVVRSLRRILPSVQGAGDQRIELYKSVEQPAMAELVRDRRLGSPDHSRFYFAFSKPTTAIGSDELTTFLDLAVADLEGAKTLLGRIAGQRRQQGGSRLHLFLDRLAEIIEGQKPIVLGNVIRALADVMDKAAVIEGKGDWGRYWVWVRGRRLLRTILAELGGKERQGAIRDLFDGRSLGWVTDIFREEVFAHGVYGDRPKSDEDRLLSGSEFSIVRAIMLRRYRNLKHDALLETPDYGSLLHGWAQASSYDDVRAILEAELKDDAIFLRTLSKLRQWTSSNGKVHYRLDAEGLDKLLDVNSAKARLEALSEIEETSVEAKMLLAAFRD